MKIPELSPQPPESRPPLQTSESPASSSPSLARSFPLPTLRSLLPALHLPPDKLSASIVAFAKFFSLPLDPGVLAKIRATAMGQAGAGQTHLAPAGSVKQQYLLPQGAAGGLSEASLRAKEALAFAGLAAAGKGVELSPPALEEYAAAIDPDRHENNGRQDSHSRGQDSSESGDNADNESGEKDAVLKAAESSALLKLLNRLPGKNGQRWLAFPFSFAKKGRRFAASLKILLDGQDAANEGLAGRPRLGGKMSLDIAEQAGEKSRRWVFVLDMGRRLTVHVSPPRRPASLKAFARRLSQFMGIPAQDIAVQNMGGRSFMAPEGINELLPCIDKEV